MCTDVSPLWRVTDEMKGGIGYIGESIEYDVRPWKRIQISFASHTLSLARSISIAFFTCFQSSLCVVRKIIFHTNGPSVCVCVRVMSTDLD